MAVVAFSIVSCRSANTHGCCWRGSENVRKQARQTYRCVPFRFLP
jgi:hypothetical protein